MKRFSFLAAAFAVLFVSCTDSYEEVEQSYLPTLPDLNATFDEDTRTYVEDSKYLRWHADDRLSAFYGNTANSQYKFNGQTGDNAGSFSHIASGELTTGNAIDRIYALYPYDSSATITDQGVISYNLPAVQSYATDSFGRGANSMVAVTGGTADTFLAFKNLCGYLKVKLYGDIVVKKVELKGNAGEKIAGAATITASYGVEPLVTMSDDATQIITLDCGQGVEVGSSASDATTFWLVVPPITFADGITITVTSTSDEVFEKSTNNPVVIERNIIHPMAAFGVYGVKSSVDVVRQAIDPIFDKCTSVAEFKTYIDQIAEIDGVAEVGSSESVVYAVLDNGFTLAWGEKPEWPAPADYISETFTQAEAMLKVQQNSSSHDFLGQNLASNKKLKVGILNQTSNDNTLQHPEMRDEFEILKTKFEKAGFEVCIVNQEQLSWDFFWTDFFNFDVILWHAHGIDIELSSHRWFMCKTVEEKEWWGTISDDYYIYGRGYYKDKNGTTHQMISDLFLRRSPHKFSRGSIIFAAVCGSLKDDKKIVADVLINQKGASTYLGYDNTTCAASHASVAFFNSMLQGMTAMEAYEHLDEKYKEEDCEAKPNLDPPQPAHTAKLHLIGNKDLCIVHPQVITNDAIVDDGVVTMSGEISGWNEYISGDVGFVWATHSIEEGSEYELTVEHCEGKAVVYSEEDSKPNNAFTFTTTEPQPNAPSPFVSGSMYVCRAYAKVHNNYVYGEERLFVVDGGNNIIYYETTDGNVTGPKVGGKVGDANVLSNTYVAGVGVIVCDKDISNITMNHGFSDKSTVKSVILPESLTIIGKFAFQNCRALEKINIPDSVTSIEAKAFFNCTGIEKIELGRNIVSFGNACFYNCTGHLIIKSNITNSSALLFAKFNAVTFSDGVTSCNCSFAPIDTLEFVYFGKDFENINSGMFSGCTKLKEVVMAADGNMVSIGNGAFSGCTALSKVSLANSIKSIGNNAFSRCIIESIKLPDSVVDIGDYAFNCKSLNKVEWSNNVISLGNYAFSNTSLDKVELPNSVKYIGNHVFADCTNLSQIKLSNNLESLGLRAFSNCICLSNITLPEKLAYIGAYAFENCPALTSIVIPDSVTAMGEYTFHRCYNLSSVVIGDGLESIPEYAFAYIENLKNVKLGKSVAYIRRSAFESCSKVTSIDFPDSLLIIGPQAFMYCGFKTVIIPRNVEQILSGAFAWCESLDDFYLRPTTPPLLTGRNSIDRHDGLKIHVPKASLELYKTAEWWSDECVLPYIVGY